MSTSPESGQKNIALTAAGAVLTTGLLGIATPIEDGTVRPKEPHGQQEGSIATGVLHPGEPARPSEVAREDKVIPPTTTHLKKALEISFGPGSSYIDAKAQDTLNKIPTIIDSIVKQGKQKVPGGHSEVTVTGTGWSSDYITNPKPAGSSSFNKKEPETGSPTLDWSKQRSESGGDTTDKILTKAGLPLTTHRRHRQDVLTKNELAKFNKAARNLGQISAQEFTTNYLRGNITGKKASELYWNYVGSKMKYEVVVDNKITTRIGSDVSFKSTPGSPGTPGDGVNGYNEISAAFPSEPEPPLDRGNNPRWEVKEIGKTRKGHAAGLAQIKQPRFGKENFAQASRGNSGKQGRRGHNLRGNR